MIVSPLSFSTLSQSEEVTVTAYSGTGAASDEATTTITVVNSNSKNEIIVSFNIPNKLNEVLKKIALGDKTDFSLNSNFVDFMKCCEFGAAPAMSGSLDVDLFVDAGPFTIIGIPLPPKLKKYVSADALNVSLSAGSDAKVSGSYNPCIDKSEWAGGGDLTAGVKVGGEITAKISEIIILKAEVKGSTSITEKLSIEDLTKLRVTTNWGGLTVAASGEIEVTRFGCISFKASKTYFEQDNLLPVTIPLPF